MTSKFSACIGLFLLALFIRFGAAFAWHNTIPPPTYLRFGDSDTYWYLAKTIAQGEEYQYGSPNSKIFRAPLYPAAIAPAAWLMPQGERYDWIAILVARGIGCFLGSLCIIFIVCLASGAPFHPPEQSPNSRWHGLIRCAATGTSAGLLATFYPGAVGMSIFILSEALFCPLMILSLLFVQRALQYQGHGNFTRSLKLYGCAGYVSGLACLARPSWSLWPVILFPFLYIAIYLISNRSWAKSVLGGSFACALFCTGICIAMVPWWMRNYNITGKFVPTTLQVGASLYDGWHPGASGSSDEDMAFVLAFAKEQAGEDQSKIESNQSLESTFEWRLNQRIQNAAIDWARENSSDVIRLGLIKLTKTWSPLPVAREIGGAWIKLSEAIGYSTILCLSAIGVWSTRRQPGAWLYCLPSFYFAILHAVFIGSVRYRQPAVLVLCVMGGVGLVQIWNWIKKDQAPHESSLASSSSPDVPSTGQTE